jgi:signal transduction histidine kinase
MDQLRTLTGQFELTEARLYAERQALAARERTLLVLLIVLAVICAGGLGVLVLLEARRQANRLTHQNSVLMSEIAGREKAEAQLRQAQKMEALGQLTGGVAHDFNNMLAIIAGNLDMLLRRSLSDPDRRRQLTENALTGAHRAAALTKRLLAFSRLQPLEPAPTDVNKCVGDMSEMLRRTLGERVVVETVLAGGLWRAFVDCPQLESAILNLAVNARDAMPNGGRLTIETGNASLDDAYAENAVDVVPGHMCSWQ